MLSLLIAVVVGFGGPASFPWMLVSALAFSVAAVHRWREPRRFLWLAAGSAAAFLAFAVLHNLLYALGTTLTDAPVLAMLTEVLHVAFFLAAVAVCPIGLVVGLLGATLTSLIRRIRAQA